MSCTTLFTYILFCKITLNITYIYLSIIFLVCLCLPILKGSIKRCTCNYTRLSYQINSAPNSSLIMKTIRAISRKIFNLLYLYILFQTEWWSTKFIYWKFIHPNALNPTSENSTYKTIEIFDSLKMIECLSANIERNVTSWQRTKRWLWNVIWRNVTRT